MKRYFVEIDAVPKTRSRIHDHAMAYHAVELDANTLFGIVEVMPHSFNNLKKHPYCTLLPSAHEHTTVHDHLTGQGKTKHWAALESYGILKTDTMAETVRKVCDKSGNILLEFDR